MALDARLILAGQTPNLTNALMQGSQAAQQTNAVNDQNKLRQLYQQQGAGIANGDQNALNALAGLNPQASMDMQTARLGNENTRQVMDVRQQTNARLSREEKRIIEDRAAAMTKAERDATIAQIQTGLSELAPLYSRGDQAAYAAKLQELQLDPNEYGFQNFESKAAKFSEVLDVMKTFDERNAGPEPADEYGRYFSEEKAAGREPLSRIDYAQAKKGTETVYGPDGNPILVRGGAAGPPKLTVDAAKNAGFLIRTQDANKIINDLEGEGTNFFQKNLDSIPMGAGNYARSNEYQKFDQARRDFVNAILRRESGAVISEQEFANADVQYFPVPGDGPEVIAQKRKNRENAIAGLRVGSGEGAAYVDQMTTQGDGAEKAQGGNDMSLSPEAQAVFDKY